MAIRDQLEQGALNPDFPAEQENHFWESEVEVSKAISLKRIADALSGEDGDGILRQPINAYGEAIGDAIQGQIARGFQQGAGWLPRSK